VLPVRLIQISACDFNTASIFNRQYKDKKHTLHKPHISAADFLHKITELNLNSSDWHEQQTILPYQAHRQKTLNLQQ